VDSGQPGAYDLESGGAGSVCARGPLSRVGGVGPALVSGVGRADGGAACACVWVRWYVTADWRSSYECLRGQ
jgi:hypothetical protein